MEAKIPQEILDLQDDIVWETPEGWEEVRPRTLEDTSRWSIYYSRVISNGQDCYEIFWGRGATEQQDQGVEDLQIWQVLPVEVVVTKYERI